MTLSRARSGIAAVILMLIAESAVAQAQLQQVPGELPAANFSLPDTGGNTHRLSDYRGKYVLVNFWAEWCSPCIKELPSMQRAYTALRDSRFEILAVHAGPATGKTGELLERFGVKFPVLVDAYLAMQGWQVQALPTSYLIDTEGRIIYSAQGAIDWDHSASRSLLDRLLGEAAAPGSNSGLSATLSGEAAAVSDTMH